MDLSTKNSTHLLSCSMKIFLPFRKDCIATLGGIESNIFIVTTKHISIFKLRIIHLYFMCSTEYLLCKYIARECIHKNLVLQLRIQFLNLFHSILMNQLYFCSIYRSYIFLRGTPPPSGIVFRYPWTDLAEIFRQCVCCADLVFCKFLVHKGFPLTSY